MQRGHRDLLAWQEAMKLVEAVYALDLPKEERFGLLGQMRRAAVSVPSNIAEGAAKGSTREFYRSLNISRGSLAELDTQIELAARIYQVDCTATRLQLERVAKLVSALTLSIRSKLNPPAT
ncbi:four helix bundle protein [Roseateles sp.]|uniref:four helix bundle protein n=1 Tax=Roseateles sp. TaxID=1971397 RepID=UPI003D0AA154